MNSPPARLVLLGHPVAHSLSPRMQDAALASAGIRMRYEAWDIPPAGLRDALASLSHFHGAGNVTVPHKRAAWELCAQKTAIAERIGAVNAFRHEDGVLVGENTDVAGFQALAESLLGPEPRGLQVALLGAGGGAAAVCAAVGAWQGSRVTIHARRLVAAAALADRFPGVATAASTVEAAVQAADVVVNATPVGLHGDEMPTAIEVLPRDAAVMDLAYRLGETPWVRVARAAGHRAADGLEMLIAQGAHAFEWWFGIPADREAMRRSLDEG